jgi:two-component system response regulator NreC
MDLLYAIKAVMNGEVYIQPSMLTGFINNEAGAAATNHENLSEHEKLWQLLSPREQEVVQGVAKGFTSKEIAEKYFLSEKTVATYRSRAMTKLGFDNRAELVDFIVRLGKID